MYFNGFPFPVAASVEAPTFASVDLGLDEYLPLESMNASALAVELCVRLLYETEVGLPSILEIRDRDGIQWIVQDRR